MGIKEDEVAKDMGVGEKLSGYGESKSRLGVSQSQAQVK